MAKILAGDTPWRHRPDRRTVDRRRRPVVRNLVDADTPQLVELVDRDPSANVFMASQLEAAGTAAQTLVGAQTLGVFEPDGTLRSACWAGANIVPVGIGPSSGDGELVGKQLGRSGRRFSSIFGEAEAVSTIWSSLKRYAPEPFAIRPDQPFMQALHPPSIEPAFGLRFTDRRELELLLPACVAMFEEEVGYSPYLGGEEHYRKRVQWLIRQRHSLVDLDDAGSVLFKAEFGTVSAKAVQIQGVWINHHHRGRGLSAGYMAAVAAIAAQTAPLVSLYVNSYNERAIAAYRAAGFEQTGTFATVLF